MHSILFACALDGICHMHSQKLRTENRRCLVSSKSADYDPEENDPVFPYPAIRSSASSAAAHTFPSASSERAGTAALDGICHMFPPPQKNQVQKIEDESYLSCAIRQKMTSQKKMSQSCLTLRSVGVRATLLPARSRAHPPSARPPW